LSLTAPYVGQLSADSAANPTNKTLSTAIANLSCGNDANGAKEIAATTALLRVALGDTAATPCFNASGAFVTGCGQTYDVVITLSPSLPINYTRPVSTSSYDAIRMIEHETDEVLGGGGAGSTLNAVVDGSVRRSSRRVARLPPASTLMRDPPMLRQCRRPCHCGRSEAISLA
jgi:hypothetical protein